MKKNLCFAITQLQSALRKVSGNWLPGLVWLLLFSVPAVAQTKKITGKITDEQNKPLEGVSISVRPTGSGTTTNAEGEFTLNVPASAETLVFSAVGYLEKEMTITNNTTINVALKKDVAGLNEVVVVGYGTQKKGNLTGSVSVIGSQQIERRPNTSTSNALQGLAPGVTVTSQTGSPGGDGGQIRIRGINSFGGSSSNPLVIIDGVAGSIDDIDVNLIESVSVLKDAASSAIYGSRAANGVILITTKRAKDKLSVNYRGFVGKQSPTDIPKVTDGLTYMKVFNDASMNDNNIKIYSDEDIEEFRKKYEANPKNYDWQDAILDGSGLMQNHFISLMANSGIVRVNQFQTLYLPQ